MMNFPRIVNALRSNGSAINHLRVKQILMNGSFCATCQIWRTQIRDTSAELDGYKWRCKICKTKVSIRNGSFFSNQHCCMQTNIAMMWFFSYQIQICTMHNFMAEQLTTTTISNYWNMFRDLMTQDMAREDTQLGGPGIVVEMDESYFSGTRKGNVGRQARESRWIFGMLDITTKQCVVFLVEDRSADTLLRKIQENVADGSIIHTDGWASYGGIARLHNNYTHHVVIHKENFVDPQTGTHTQNIENFWGHIKAPWKRCRGLYGSMVGAYLDEMQWRWNHRDLDPYTAICALMAEFYNTNAANMPLAPRIRAQRPNCKLPTCDCQ
jgi:transposase-like protein